MFIGAMGIMEGRSPAQINQKFGDIYLPALSANWKVWPLAQVRLLVLVGGVMAVRLTFYGTNS